MRWTRRRVLQAGSAIAGVSVAAGLLLPARGQARPANQGAADPGAAADVKRIALLNLHTDERLEIAYFSDGAYVPEALAAIENCLRDFRTGERHAMDPRLMDDLVDVARSLRVEPSFSVISGYRSPRSNAMLHEHSAGVAQHSLHMEGRAIDVRISGVDCADLAAQALDMKRGGVGYYRASNFVHLDTGAFRTWKG
jgi:uncharacterized protein YcbK (DUF882 family)